MAGIYIHIPFCRRACHYCNFHFSTSLSLQNEFVSALLKEIELQKDFLNPEIVSTIYFGGGTPSLLEQSQLEAIINAIHKQFSIDPDLELTLETNPDDISLDRARQWKLASINRLSIGIQSFFEADLLWMNRAHNAEQAYSSILHAQEAGIHNLTIDLIYGTPTLPDEHWLKNLDTAIGLKIPHLSCYALTVEPKTALEKLIRAKKMPEVKSDDQARQFTLLMQYLRTHGYEHYEISNFSIPGFRSRHNSSYWRGLHYLGLGPSAHSFRENIRQWNVANNALYIQSINNGTIPFEKEILTEVQQLNEYVMTASRTIEGINLAYIEEKYGLDTALEIIRKSENYLANNLVTRNQSRLILSDEGKLFADAIAAQLFS